MGTDEYCIAGDGAGIDKVSHGTCSGAAQQVIMLVIRFRVRDFARFLSHAETIRVLQRACIRAAVQLEYSGGFNPRPRMSLPLPRPVGVEADDELLCLRVRCSDAMLPAGPENSSVLQHRQQIRAELSRQLPEGFDILAVELAEPRSSFQARGATYVFPVERRRLDLVRERLAVRVRFLMDSETLPVERAISDQGIVRRLDVRPFLKSIEVDDKSVVAECKIDPAGSIRVDEILNLLELELGNLGGPVRRTHVEWQRR